MGTKGTMMNTSQTANRWRRVLNLCLALCVAWSQTACSDPPMTIEDPALAGFLDDTGYPPEPEPMDNFMRMKADVLVLPAISVTVWAIGALMVYIGGQAVLNTSIEDFELVLDQALGRGEDWSWAEDIGEPSSQAVHLTESLNRIAYRSEASDFYSISGNDYIRFLNMMSAVSTIDPAKLRDLLDGKVRPWGQYAKDFFAALQVASVQARHLSEGNTAEGLCARATVYSLTAPRVPYLGLARARGKVDIIPAAVLASVKATIRCGMYDADVREFIYSFYNVSGARGLVADIFISHMLKTAKLLHKYVDVCQMPPKIVVNFDQGDCHDVTLN